MAAPASRGKKCARKQPTAPFTRGGGRLSAANWIAGATDHGLDRPHPPRSTREGPRAEIRGDLRRSAEVKTAGNCPPRISAVRAARGRPRLGWATGRAPHVTPRPTERSRLCLCGRLATIGFQAWERLRARRCQRLVDVPEPRAAWCASPLFSFQKIMAKCVAEGNRVRVPVVNSTRVHQGPPSLLLARALGRRAGRRRHPGGGGGLPPLFLRELRTGPRRHGPRAAIEPRPREPERPLRPVGLAVGAGSSCPRTVRAANSAALIQTVTTAACSTWTQPARARRAPCALSLALVRRQHGVWRAAVHALTCPGFTAEGPHLPASHRHLRLPLHQPPEVIPLQPAEVLPLRRSPEVLPLRRPLGRLPVQREPVRR
jgi:hypothetical protein